MLTMQQPGTSSNNMTHQQPPVPLAALVMPGTHYAFVDPAVASTNHVQNLMDVSTPEVEKALLDSMHLHQYPKLGAGTNAVMDDFVRVLANINKDSTSNPSTVAEPSFSDFASSPSPRSISEQSEFSASSPGSATSSGATDNKTAAFSAGIVPQAQEELKKQRKKERNRVAAMKCRRRKIEREADLDGKVKALKSENSTLTAELVQLRSQVYTLKQTVMEHIGSGCNIFQGEASRSL